MTFILILFLRLILKFSFYDSEFNLIQVKIIKKKKGNLPKLKERETLFLLDNLVISNKQRTQKLQRNL